MIRMSEAADRGHDTSEELVEVRTVLSRAESARATILRWIENEADHHYRRGGSRDYQATPPVRVGGTYDADRDAREMVAALDTVIERLARWRRTGRTSRS